MNLKPVFCFGDEFSLVVCRDRSWAYSSPYLRGNFCSVFSPSLSQNRMGAFIRVAFLVRHVTGPFQGYIYYASA